MNKTLLLAALAVSGTVSGQVYRCEAAGKVTYTDAPCHSGAMRSVDVQPNSVHATRPALVAPLSTSPERHAPSAGLPQVVARPVLPPGSCPSETEIKNIHTRLSASVIPAANRRALYVELEKAERCPSLGRRYSYDDWKRLEGVLRGDD
jgi:hypothetical protein